MLEGSLREACARGQLVTEDLPKGLVIERPREAKHGHLATNVAMILARPERKNPRVIAQTVLDHLNDGDGLLEAWDIAGPGFINFTFTAQAWQRVLYQVLTEGEHFGWAPSSGQRVNVEFVSANPTGPLHVGHARGALTGDAIARLLEAAGHDVSREYYVNDAGKQVETLARSVLIRYQQLLGEDVALPEDHYPGDYIRPIAALALERYGDAHRQADPFAEDGPWMAPMRDLAITENLAGIQATLENLGIHFDHWQSERELVASGAIETALDHLKEGDFLFEEEGKLWFRSTDFGDDKDRVVIRDNGVGTYFASDIAYHRDKLERQFDRIIDVWGADHGGYVRRVSAALAALGLPADRFAPSLVQMVNLVKDGKAFKIGKRSGNMILLQELLDEVGPDVLRFLFLMRRSDAQYDFDLGLAMEQSMENPVYYVQYGHARLCSILRRAESQGLSPCSFDAPELARLTHPDEVELIRLIAEWPETLQDAAAALEPHRLAHYLMNLVGTFHGYYTRNRKAAPVVSLDDPEASRARLLLCDALAITLRAGLSVLGVGAPERMDREEVTP